MTRPQRHSPAPHRQERDIHRPKLSHAVVQVGVTRDVDPLLRLEDMSDCGGMRPMCQPWAPTMSGMVGWHGGDGQLAVRQRLANAQFLDVREPLPVKPRTRATRNHDPGVANQP